MLKRIHIIAFAIAFACAAWLVALYRQETLRASVPLTQRMVVLDTDASAANRTDAVSARIPQRAKINPLAGELFLRTIDMNIDDDEEFEEVILVRKSTDSRELYLVAAEFAPLNGTYFRFAEAPLGQVDSDSIIVLAEDVTSDGIADLVVQGLDVSNQQFLAVLRRDGTRGYGIAFSGIAPELSLMQDASDTPERSARIVSQLPLESEKKIVRTEFKYNPRLRTFEQLSKNIMPMLSMPGQDIPPGTSAQEYLKWLQRLWIRTGSDGPRELYFDTDNQEVIFSSGSIQQRWVILNTARSGSRLYINCSTSESSDLDRAITVETMEKNSIFVSILDQQVSRFRRDEGWSGIYETKPKSASAMALEAPSFSLDELAGRYLGLDNSVLVIDGSKTIFVTKGTYREGIAHAHSWNGVQVLEFLTVDANGIPGERLLFAASVKRKSDGKIALLVLEPASAGPSGISILRRPPLVFTKTS